MKTKRVFVTLGLALTMGATVGAAAIMLSNKKAVRADAWASSYWSTPYP